MIGLGNSLNIPALNIDTSKDVTSVRGNTVSIPGEDDLELVMKELENSNLTEGEKWSVEGWLKGLLSSAGLENQMNRYYNSAEARAQRTWYEEFAGSAYQRATADLRKAGLNPLLAVTGGGASSATAGLSPGSAASYNVGGGDTLTNVINALANTADAVASFVSPVSKILGDKNAKSVQKHLQDLVSGGYKG